MQLFLSGKISLDKDNHKFPLTQKSTRFLGKGFPLSTVTTPWPGPAVNGRDISEDPTESITVLKTIQYPFYLLILGSA